MLGEMFHEETKLGGNWKLYVVSGVCPFLPAKLGFLKDLLAFCSLFDAIGVRRISFMSLG